MGYTYDEEILSDLYKEAYYHRPDSAWWDWWSGLTKDKKQETWDCLVSEAENTYRLECKNYLEACKRFETSINRLMDTGAKTRAQAIKWYLDTLDLDPDELGFYGGGLVCYELGLDSVYGDEIWAVLEEM